MVKKRLIVSLLWRDGFLIQSINFKHTNAVGSVITAMEFFNAWEADEILLLNVTREDKNFQKFLQTLKELSKYCFVPLTAGGWVQSLERVDLLLENGADKVVVNTQAYKTPEFITAVAQKYGSQCVIVSIDARKTGEARHEVFIDRGREPTGREARAWALAAQERGAGEIFLTSIDHDGSKQGYDRELIAPVAAAMKIPVIIFGGVGNWEHLAGGLKISGVDAVAAGNIFHYFEQSVRQAKRHLISVGMDVRIPDNFTM
ncbi:MAG: imidazole glycerol phosphate synthase cyclase subunit [Candidatus Margulisiibacteriota bacterium]